MPFVRVRGSWMVKHPAASLDFGLLGSSALAGRDILIGALCGIFQKNSLLRPSLILGVQRRRRMAAWIYNLFRVAMSIAAAENFLRNSREQVSQKDINDSYLKAMTELTREVKRLEDEIRRVRRDVLVSRRF